MSRVLIAWSLAKVRRECDILQAMNPTHDEILFVSFCVEMYARRHEMSGEAVMRLFDGLGVCEFLVESYDPLHSLDREAILDEIEVFMKGAQVRESA